MLKFIAFAAFVAGLGCSATTAGTVAQGAAVACSVGLPLVGEAGFAPICATIPEIEAVIAAWVNEAKASPGVAPKKHTTTDLYNAVVALRASGKGPTS
jgi:hypothetical protein